MNTKSEPQNRYYSYATFTKNRFGKRMQKIPINAGFSCPNRDGTKGIGGCTYCNNISFNPFYGNLNKTITQQIEEGIDFFSRKYSKQGYLAYFQAYSNSYEKFEVLKKKYEEALENPLIEGLIIGTRPDCIDDKLLSYLSETNKYKYICIEYGIETIHNNILKSVNRCHTFEDSVEAIKKTASYKIDTGIHLIFGLPGETIEMMREIPFVISKLPINNIKFHQLQIIKGTIMAEEFRNFPNRFTLFSLEEYVEFICDFLERINPKIVVERFISESPPKLILAPNWKGIRTYQILNMIEARLEGHNTFQGRLFKKEI